MVLVVAEGGVDAEIIVALDLADPELRGGDRGSARA